MISVRPRRLVDGRLIFTSSLALLLCQNVWAQPEPSANEPDRRIERTGPIGAEVLFHQGVADFQAGRFADALDRFDRSARLIPAANYYRGMALLELDRPAEAADAFANLPADASIPKKVDLDHGIALLRAARVDEAVTKLTGYVQSNPADPDGNLLLALALYEQGNREAARNYFEIAVRDEGLQPTASAYLARIDSELPGAGMADSLDTPATDPMATGEIAQRADQAEKNAEQERRWNFTLLTAYQYDSNVPLAPNIIGLGAVDQKADSSALVASFGDFRLIQQERFNLGVISSTYDNFLFDMSEFNLQDYMGGAYTNAAFGRYLVGVNYQYHETLLGGSHLSGEHRLVPNVTQRQGDFGHLTVYYEFDAADIDAPALIPQQFRSGIENSVGFTQAVYFWESGRVYGGYRFAGADTQGSDFDFLSNMVTGRVEVPIGEKTIADAEVRVFWYDYQNGNSLDFLERNRHDTRIEVRAGLQRYFTKHVSVRLDYTYISNNSNVANLFDVEFYTYDRHVLCTQFIYDF